MNAPRSWFADQTLDLRPGYTSVALREHGDAFAHACAIAPEAGAGTRVWVRQYGLVEFAALREPDEPVRPVRGAQLAGMNAAAGGIDLNGDLLMTLPTAKGTPQRPGLVDALANVAWYDAAHRGPRFG